MKRNKLNRLCSIIQQELEPFEKSCREGAKFLVGIMEEIVEIEGLPRNVQDTQKLIDQHEDYVRKAIEDPQLLQLQEVGDTTLETLHSMEKDLCHCNDYR